MAVHNDIISRLVKAGSEPVSTIKASMAVTGKEPFGCFPPRVPEELVYAAGYLPVGMWGGKTRLVEADRYLQGFCCTVMRANMELGLKGAYSMLKGVLIPALCDSLKCVGENWKEALPNLPAIVTVYPQNRSSEAGIEYMINELHYICEELGAIRGKEVTEEEVEKAFAVYEEYRAAMREFVDEAARFPVTIGAKTRHLIVKAGQFMDKAVYTAEIRALTEALKTLPNEPFYGLRAVVTGLMDEPLELLDLFEENNIAFVADDLSQCSRQFRTLARNEGSVWERMAYIVADIQGDTFLFEAEKLKCDMIVNMVKEKKADAAIMLMTKFCDPEEFDYPIIKKRMEQENIPLLYLETDQQMDSVEQLRTRVQSFAEMLI